MYLSTYFLNAENKQIMTFSLWLLFFVEACSADKCETCTVKSDPVNIYSWIHSEEISQREIFFF